MGNLGKIRQIVGIFKDADKLQATIDALGLLHFERREINVLDNESNLKKKLGKNYGTLEQIMDNPQTPQTIHIAPEEFGIAAGAIIGIMILISVITAFLIMYGVTTNSPTIIVIVGIGIGIIIGGIIIKILQKIRVKHLNKQLEKGGLILWVNVSSKQREKLAWQIFKKFAAQNIHIREIAI